MKKLITLVLLAVVCASCAKDNDVDHTLYIVSSAGAFNGEKAVNLLPSSAQVIITNQSEGRISLTIDYYWWYESNGFIIEIPSISINGTSDNYTINEQCVSANCRMNISKLDYNEISLNVNGYYNSGAKDNNFKLVISPSDNTICPWLDIRDVRNEPIKLEECSGIDVEWVRSLLTFCNQLTVPVIVNWDDVIGREVFEANTFRSIWCEYEEDLICDGHITPNLPKPTIIISEQEYAIDFFIAGSFSVENCLRYHFMEDGSLDLHRYKHYSFNITPELYDSLLENEID